MTTPKKEAEEGVAVMDEIAEIMATKHPNIKLRFAYLFFDNEKGVQWSHCRAAMMFNAELINFIIRDFILYFEEAVGRRE